MITIHQIQLTSDQIDAVNAGSKVEAFETKNKLSIFGAFKSEMFSHFTAAFKVNTLRLEEAFEWTNLWNRQDKVDVLGDRNHSSSVGDIFELNGEFFLCSNFGFKQIKVEEV
ncbi:MAG TPA: hypothetical protein DCW83_08695 [Saprospirales bacterium]|jgi:hypothetical protein|nr:hypothetical protein [Saprospirales bacterium]